jgi:predicted DNA-binding transcriptional regulator AlpA
VFSSIPCQQTTCIYNELPVEEGFVQLQKEVEVEFPRSLRLGLKSIRWASKARQLLWIWKRL